MKRWIYPVIALLLFTLMPLQPVGAASDFPDISNHWAKEYIQSLASSGYIKGYQDGTFKPDQVVTRAEFITVLIACSGSKPTDTSSIAFSDTKNHWALASINEAVKKGIVVTSEYSGGLKPNGGIVRSEAAAMLVRALGKSPDNSATTFKDQATLSQSMYKGYIKTACDLGLLTGYPNGNFEPFQVVTRAQMCKVMTGFLEQLTPGTGTSITPGAGQITGSFASLAIGEDIYDLNKTIVSFRTGFNDIPVSSLSTTQGYLYINNQYRYALNTDLSDLDIIVSNNRYSIKQINVSGDRLVVFPDKRKFSTVSANNQKFDSDYVKLYINGAYSDQYLSDLSITDGNNVVLGTTTYNLSRDRVTVELGSLYYDIKSIALSASETTPQLVQSDSVITDGLSLSNITAIFVGTTLLNMATINDIDFIIDGKRYDLSAITVDAAGKITVDNKTYDPDEATMIIGDEQYVISNILMNQGKLIIYCSSTASSNWVMVNDVYRDASKVKIIKDDVMYTMDQVMVVSRNVVRINNKQQSLDSTIKCSLDGKIYAIDEINYNTANQVVTIELSDSVVTGTQPVKFEFYKGSSLYLDGATSAATIYASGKWLSFDDILITDPSHFSYNGASNNLIGALVRIDGVDFEVTDTAWHGSSQILDIYIKQI